MHILWRRIAYLGFMISCPMTVNPNRAGYDKVVACADEALGKLEETDHGVASLP